jgi:PPOX class probable F420-dependent enzyme
LQQRDARPIVHHHGMQRTIEDVRALVAREHGLTVVATRRADGSSRASVVNAGVIDDPLGGGPVLAFVARGGTHKLRDLRSDPRLTCTLRVGWEWLTVEGEAVLIGPDDPAPGAGAGAVDVRMLLRDIFHAAGGTHDDLDAYDAVMAAERRTAVIVHATRVYGNAPSHEHVEH